MMNDLESYVLRVLSVRNESRDEFVTTHTLGLYVAVCARAPHEE